MLCKDFTHEELRATTVNLLYLGTCISFYDYHNVTFRAWPCGMAIVYALGCTSTCTTSIIMVKASTKKNPKNLILVACCFTKYYSITDFGVQLSLFFCGGGGFFHRVTRLFFLFSFFWVQKFCSVAKFLKFLVVDSMIFFLKMKSPKIWNKKSFLKNCQISIPGSSRQPTNK